MPTTVTLRLLVPTLLLLALCAPLAAALAVGPLSVETPASADAPVVLRGAEVPLEPSALPLPVSAPSFTRPIPLPAALQLPAVGEPRVPAVLGGIDIIPKPAMPAAPAPVRDATPEDAAVAAAAGSTALWLLLERLAVGRAAFGMYSRLTPSALLEHERRERILALVRERPGIGPQDVGHALGTSWGVTQYHLDKLEKAGLVSSQRAGHHRCYFLPGSVPREQQKTVGLLRVDTTRRVAALVAERPGLTQTQLCAELGISASAMSKQVSRLEGAGVLRREASEGPARLYPDAALGPLLA